MKTWYSVICHKCGEGQHIFVTNPICTKDLLEDESLKIQKFMEKHYGCELSLIWRDDQIDKLFDEGWKGNRSDKTKPSYTKEN
jgi:hypothetical protein